MCIVESNNKAERDKVIVFFIKPMLKTGLGKMSNVSCAMTVKQ